MTVVGYGSDVFHEVISDVPDAVWKKVSPRRRKMLSAMMEGLAPVIHEYVAAEIKKATAPLKAELAALKAKPELKYAGVWQPRSYPEGAIVTHSGSAWHCNRLTAQKPGASADWTLMVKHGKDAR